MGGREVRVLHIAVRRAVGGSTYRGSDGDPSVARLHPGVLACLLRVEGHDLII